MKKIKSQTTGSPNKVKNKIHIIGDSHVRNLATKLQDNLGEQYNISSFVKPTAPMSEITKMAKEEIKNLKGDDTLVWGGANDISKNNSTRALKLLSEFIIEHKEINMVVINSPHRQDLLPNSCVNQEVNTFNRKLSKIMKLHPNAQVLEVELDRNHFTRHGLHLNSERKSQLSQKLSLLIQNFKTSNQEEPIPAPWRDPLETDINSEVHEPSISIKKKSSTNSPLQRRNCPAHKNPDFLWS